jgi:hypothetical protein
LWTAFLFLEIVGFGCELDSGFPPNAPLLALLIFCPQKTLFLFPLPVNDNYDRLANSSLKGSALFKPTFGAAGKMANVIAPVSPKLSPKMEGPFSANLNATLSSAPSGLSNPSHVLKMYVRR